MFCFVEPTSHTYIGQPYGDEVKPSEYNCFHIGDNCQIGHCQRGNMSNEIFRLCNGNIPCLLFVYNNAVLYFTNRNIDIIIPYNLFSIKVH